MTKISQSTIDYLTVVQKKQSAIWLSLLEDLVPLLMSVNFIVLQKIFGINKMLINYIQTVGFHGYSQFSRAYLHFGRWKYLPGTPQKYGLTIKEGGEICNLAVGEAYPIESRFPPFFSPWCLSVEVTSSKVCNSWTFQQHFVRIGGDLIYYSRSKPHIFCVD